MSCKYEISQDDWADLGQLVEKVNMKYGEHCHVCNLIDIISLE